ncbi:MAG: hypothetical protein LBQ60_14415 [Bacteroidales bacterium]|jgi:hypothetical protein|nr:hypothetical protein [Bacteroidales bacterium]
MLGDEVPYEQYITFFGKPLFGTKISSTSRGKYLPIYELAYRHYNGRKGLEMLYTGKVIHTKTRNEGVEAGFMPWATLMYAR